AAVVDVISRGRLILGVGMGYREYEYAGLGLSMRQRRSLMEEGLEVVRRCWTEPEGFSHAGRHWQLRDVRVRPLPVQRPHPPIWFGAGSVPAMERSARFGASFVCAPVPPLRQIRRQMTLYQDLLRQAGHDPAGVELGLMREVYVTDDPDQAWRDVREHFLHVYRDTYGPDQVEYIDIRPDGTRRRVTDPHDPFFESARFREDRFIFGDPELVAREVRRYLEETPTTLFIARMQLPGMPHEKVTRSMRLFAERVMPQFNA
ncbi:MAG TPA: LLM class flavin-dependent oxidoreductase, partial [Dehalococcoidia bacterium]|nr:LLM class flavin-dependent oxidoreductase [Dehalococcoidia bacterium]